MVSLIPVEKKLSKYVLPLNAARRGKTRKLFCSYVYKGFETLQLNLTDPEFVKDVMRARPVPESSSARNRH
jgi:hypothetical protein